MKLCPLCETMYPTSYTTCGKDGCGALLVESGQFEPGTVIRDKYRIVRFIGRGGMGTVYLAEHIHLNERHALKFITGALTHDSRVLRRFRLEAQALRRLTDPNIVEVYDLDQANDGSFYIAMEFVNGLSLREVISAGPLPVERAITIARGVASGLAAAHAKNIIHRDIKPDNILLDHSAFSTTGVETPKLLDFGISAVKETSAVMSHTRGFLLTAEYAAPEQWKGMSAGQLDGRTDLYALGGILHEMLTGTTSLQSESFDGWMYQHLQAERNKPSKRRPELVNWPGLDALVLSLLNKDRDQRPSDAIAVIEQLARLKHHKPIVVQPAHTKEKDDRLPPLRHTKKISLAEEKVVEKNVVERKTVEKKVAEKKSGERKLVTQPEVPYAFRRWVWICAGVTLLFIIGFTIRRATRAAANVTIAGPAGLQQSRPSIESHQPAVSIDPPPPPQSKSPGVLTVALQDAGGAAVIGNTVTIWDQDQKTSTCLTSESGTCTIDNLAAGTYRLRPGSTSGLNSYQRKGIVVQPGIDTKVDIVMTSISDSRLPAPDTATIASQLNHAKTLFDNGTDNCRALQEYTKVLRETMGQPALIQYNSDARTGAARVKAENRILGVSCSAN